MLSAVELMGSEPTRELLLQHLAELHAEREEDRPVCSCQVHDAMKHDEAVWGLLKFIGVQNVDGRPFAALSNCPCGSTLARLCDGVELH